ncbi:hypothetical protein DPMN_027722 [Dreissena polymorpha]|uniref:Uncharacterized protein n=1 Tax=Dreissena polymorpha TaxID=45954 RepID=A0A9D4LTE1_DREPO|nr:hypothetical protein DPMN_027722 [Dreissena polymorpha]
MLLSRLAQLLSTAFQEAGQTPWSWLAKVDHGAIHSSLESFANDLGVCLEDLINFPQPPSLLRFCVPVKEARYVLIQVSTQNLRTNDLTYDKKELLPLE